jgi:hypothetical protein
MAVGGTSCTPLRRTVWATVFDGGFGLLLLFTAVTLIWVSFVEGEVLLAVSAVVPVGIWSVSFAKGVRLCSGVLLLRSVLLNDRRYPISSLLLVEVGMLREGRGPIGYVGHVLAIETDSTRDILYNSRYCGRRRLESWAARIRKHPDFRGELRIGSGDISSRGTPTP